MMKTIVLAAVLLAGSMSSAFSHAALSSAEPRVGSTVSAPREVVLTFTEQLEPAFSAIEVRDASGKRVDGGKSAVKGNILRVVLKSLPPGPYTVKWRVLSVDTHKSEGSFSFTVQQ